MQEADIRQDEISDKSLKSKIDFFAKAIEVNEVKKGDEIFVATIDLGTTHSGWGFQSHFDFESDRTKHYVKKWAMNDSPLATEKTPSVILINPDGKTVKAFGYEAEEKYADLSADEKQIDYFYFKRFKMTLNKKLGEKIDEHTLLEDSMGNTLPAIVVFSLAMKYLLDDMFKEINRMMAGSIEKSDIRYIITVPAIWTPTAKQFMRKAGERAGIPTDNLSIALEPEAASIFCRHLPVGNTFSTRGVSIASFPAGTRYILLDAGGGTIDMTVHEVLDEHKIKEMKAASGGGWGGILVDDEFEKLIINIVGWDTYITFKHEDTFGFLELWRHFERKKQMFIPEEDYRIVMPIPISLVEIFKEKTGKRLSEAIESSDFSANVQFREKRSKMTFEATVFKKLFETSIPKIIKHTENLFRDEGVKHIETILMVGGFSESLMLQNSLQSHFKDKCIITPFDASSSIMRGAVIYGQYEKRHKQTFVQRISQYTYGVSTLGTFVEGIHPEKRRVSTDAGVRCRDVFDKHVEKDQAVIVGEPQLERTYTPAYKTQTSMTVELFASIIKNPQYTDEDCISVGKMTVKLPDLDGDLHRKVLVSLTFSGTEIKVQALDVKRNEKTKAWLDFLG